MHNNDTYHVVPINLELAQHYTRLIQAAYFERESLDVGV